MEGYLEKVFETALVDIGAPAGTSVKFEVPQNAEHGDLSTNVAMALAKILQQPPRKIASEIIGRLKFDNAHVRSVEIAGPGFINISFSREYFIG